ncbi:MAG: hypothetical protein ACYS18_03635 [Planctomycetota bacterium]|jgi:hypothetical protein
MKSQVFGSLLVFVMLCGFCVGAPEPSVVPEWGEWTLEVQFTHPQQIVVGKGIDNQPRRFWYMILTMTNKTRSDVDFYPRCEIMTDDFELTPSGKGVSGVVFEQIKRRHQGRYPFLEAVEKAGNRILQGEDNTKDVAIIWPDFGTQTKDVKVFIAGLSNETVLIKHPVAKDENGQAVKVFLRKTLELTYSLPGDAAVKSGENLSYESKRWVMR